MDVNSINSNISTLNTSSSLNLEKVSSSKPINKISELTEKRASLTAGSGVGATMIALTELLTGVFDEVDSIVAVFVSVPASVATP